MSKFSRRLDQNIINKLKAEPLFSDCLLPDIEKGHVFPAVRNNRVHFYCGGRRLFEYTASGFRTHVKFASVLIGKRNGYIDESQLNGVNPYLVSRTAMRQLRRFVRSMQVKKPRGYLALSPDLKSTPGRQSIGGSSPWT